MNAEERAALAEAEAVHLMTLTKEARQTCRAKKKSQPGKTKSSPATYAW
jgi:hypothetical protein